MTDTTAIAKLNDATIALREAFETHGTEWNENGKTLVDFQKAEHVAKMSDRVQYLETMQDGFKNYDFAIAKVAPLIAEIASKRAPCYLFSEDDSEEDVAAGEDVSIALSDFVACFDKSNEEIAAEISDFIKEKDADFDFTGGHTIPGAWDKAIDPAEIDLDQVENVLDMALDGWADGAGYNSTEQLRNSSRVYLSVLRTNPPVMAIVVTDWLEIIREVMGNYIEEKEATA